LVNYIKMIKPNSRSRRVQKTVTNSHCSSPQKSIEAFMTTVTDNRPALTIVTNSIKKRGLIREQSLTRTHNDYVNKYVYPVNQLNSMSLNRVINMTQSMDAKNMRNVLNQTAKSQ